MISWRLWIWPDFIHAGYSEIFSFPCVWLIKAWSCFIKKRCGLKITGWRLGPCCWDKRALVSMAEVHRARAEEGACHQRCEMGCWLTQICQARFSHRAWVQHPVFSTFWRNDRWLAWLEWRGPCRQDPCSNIFEVTFQTITLTRFGKPARSGSPGDEGGGGDRRDDIPLAVDFLPVMNRPPWWRGIVQHHGQA